MIRLAAAACCVLMLAVAPEARASSSSEEFRDFTRELIPVLDGDAGSLDPTRLMEIATLAREGGDWRVAQEAAFLALSRWQEGDPVLLKIRAYYYLGAISKSIGVLKTNLEPLEYYNQALELVDRNDPESAAMEPFLLRAIATSLRRLTAGGADSAAKYNDRALGLANRLRPEDRIPHLAWVGWGRFHRGYYEEGLILAREALAIMETREEPNHFLRAVCTNLLGDQAMLAGDWATAESFYASSVRDLEASWTGTFAGFPRASIPMATHRQLSATRLLQGKPEEAWPSAIREAGRLDLEFLKLSAWETEDPQTHAKYVAWTERAIAHRLTWEERLGLANGEQIPDSAVLRWLTGVRARLEAQALVDRFLQSSPIPYPDVETVRSGLAPGSALVGWLDLDTGNGTAHETAPIRDLAWAYVIRADVPGITWVPLWHRYGIAPLGGDHSLRAAVSISANFRTELVKLTTPVPADPFLESQHRLLGHWFFDPILDQLDDLVGVDHLVVVPPLMNMLPVQKMILPDGRRLIERFSVSYLTSATLLPALRERRRRPLLDMALLLGPPFSGAVSDAAESPLTVSMLHRAVSGDPTALALLPELPYAIAELDDVEANVPNTVRYDRERATEANIRALADLDELRQFSLIHIATHHVTSGHAELSGLAFRPPGQDLPPGTDGLIDVEEIRLWNLDAELVVLSACQTATFGGQPNFYGIVQSLWEAGARSILVTFWNVDDAATRILMRRFYQNVSGNYTDSRRGRAPGTPLTKAAALAEAQVYLRDYEDETGNRPYEHPIYWTGFNLIGLPD